MNLMSTANRTTKSRPNLSRSHENAQVPRLELVTPATRPVKLASPFVGDPFMVSSPTRAEIARAVRARVGHLIEFVRAGRIFDAIEEFYAPDVELSRGALAPMFGFESRAGRKWVHTHADAEWRSFRVRGVGVNGDTSFIESSLDFVSARPGGLKASGNRDRFTMNQVAVAQWRDGKIVKECLIPRR